MNFKALYKLTKPGVTYGNLITTSAGYLFAANGVIDWTLFITLTIGTWLVIASACVINNYLDQDIDTHMERTKNRPLLTGEVTNQQAVIFGSLLGVIGFSTLILFTNWWVVGVGAVGWVVYVWLYGALGKRRSVHGTLVGSISGATPILAGYVAVYPRLDWAGALLFAFIFFWQMPEFYSISIYRRREYAKAKIPVSSVVRGVDSTKKQIFIYALLTIASALLLKATPLASWTYFVVMLALSLRWVQILLEGSRAKDNDAWAKRHFHYVLKVLVTYCVVIAINPWLP